MDNLCHTLVGAAIAQATPLRRSPLALATAMVGANLPDVDGFIYVFGNGGVDALAFRRGWTHGILAMAVWPFVLTGLMLAFDRFVRRRLRPDEPPALFEPLLILSALTVVSHPLLDFLNTYGVRFLAPFSWKWFYGDALFIIDPWVWIALAAGVILSSRRRRRGAREPERPARIALMLTAAYVLEMMLSGFVGRAAEVGDSIDFDGLRFDVEEIEGSRIQKLAVTFVDRPQRRSPEDEEEEVAAEG